MKWQMKLSLITMTNIHAHEKKISHMISKSIIFSGGQFNLVAERADKVNGSSWSMIQQHGIVHINAREIFPSFP